MDPYLMSLLAHERLSTAYARADDARRAREVRSAHRRRTGGAPAASALRPGCARPIGCSA